MIKLKQKQLQTASATIHYWTTDDQSKPTIFLMHGAAMDHNMFEPQFEALAAFNIIAWDAPGHGSSRPVKGQLTITNLADDAITLLQDLGIHSAIFVGQSEGSMIAQEIYRREPALVRGLVSIGGSPIMLTYTKMDIWLLNASTSIIKIWPYKHFMTALAKKTSIKSHVQKYALETVSRIAKNDFLNIWSSVTSSLSTGGIKGMHILVPLLLCYGESDTTATVKRNNVRWKAYERHAKLIAIPDAGHNANQDNSQYFNKILTAFLEENL